MEWYYIIALVVMFIAIIAVLIYLGKKGIIGAEMINSLKTVIGGLSDLTDIFVDRNPQNPTADAIDKAMELLEKAVLAAENLWYNGKIDANERYGICVDIFTELLRVYEIDVSEKFIMVVDKLIAAACESLGHMRVTKAEVEAALLAAQEGA